jgi:hypothetical protein
VALDDVLLPLNSGSSDTMLTVGLPAFAAANPGTYRLMILAGKDYDDFELTIGAVGPEGPIGPQGDPGPQGDLGPAGPQDTQSRRCGRLAITNIHRDDPAASARSQSQAR